jgi:hypothetical protein
MGTSATGGQNVQNAINSEEIMLIAFGILKGLSREEQNSK